MTALKPNQRLIAGRVMTVQAQYRTCGKSWCRCQKGGSAHGPYFYGYWWDGGHQHSHYIGRVLPEEKGGAS